MDFKILCIRYIIVNAFPLSYLKPPFIRYQKKYLKYIMLYLKEILKNSSYRLPKAHRHTQHNTNSFSIHHVYTQRRHRLKKLKGQDECRSIFESLSIDRRACWQRARAACTASGARRFAHTQLWTRSHELAMNEGLWKSHTCKTEKCA